MPYSKEDNETPKVFHGNMNEAAVTNQKSYHQNYLQSHLEKQKEAAANLSLLLAQLEQKMEIAAKETNLKIDHQKTAALELLSDVQEHRFATESVQNELQSIKTAIQQNNETLDKEEMMNHAILEQLSFQEQAITSLSSQIQEYSQVNMDVKEKADKTEEMYQEITEKLDIQEVFHQTIIEKMEKHDAYFSKIIRQLDMLKAMIFERVHFITEKIESNIEAFAKPVQHFFLQKEKKDND